MQCHCDTPAPGRAAPLRRLKKVKMFFLFALHHVVGLDNGLGLTPPMGYNAYDHVGCCADETTLKAQGAALIATGLAKLGFVYVNADCGWMGGRRGGATAL